jgi:uncharacterized repeat protein (TIGR04138 family)
MSSIEKTVENVLEFDERLRAVARIDGRYELEAYRFVFEALQHTLSKLSEPRHVTASELLEGAGELARKKFGLLARMVFENWGVRSTSDFGEIVFILVNYGLMGKTEDDRREDFDDVFDFKSILDEEYLKELPQLLKLKKHKGS